MYITQADLIKELSESQLIQLTDDEKVGVVNADRVADAIQRASDDVDGFCGVRYAVPFSPTPPLIASWTKSLAAYYLFLRRQHIPDAVQTAYDNAIARLKEVRDGKMSLGVEPPPTESTLSHQSEILVNNSEWSRAQLKEW
jgi:phage gp36-like protein